MKLSTTTKVILLLVALAFSVVGFMLKLPSAFRYVDKELHAAFYFVAAAFLNLLFANRNLFKHAFIFIMLYLFGMAIEFSQSYSNRFFARRIHGRYDVEDIKANLTGLVLFSVCWIVLQCIWLIYRKLNAGQSGVSSTFNNSTSPAIKLEAFDSSPMELKLFMLNLGCTPRDRNTEQHDVFFGIGHSLKELVPHINNFWAGGGKIHIDSWREVTNVDGYSISVHPKEEAAESSNHALFFLNLGGYKMEDPEEYHYKIITVAKDKAEAISKSKKTAFFLHFGFKGAESHIDDKYGIDIDDIYAIDEVLNNEFKEMYTIRIRKSDGELPLDKNHPGYLKLSAL